MTSQPHIFLLSAALLVSCASDPTPELGRSDVGDQQDQGARDVGGTADETDMGKGTVDVGLEDVGEDAGVLQGCAALSPAACFADGGCTLRDSCVDASPDDEPFRYSLTGSWDVVVRSEGDKGLPAGDVPGSLALFRTDDRGFRGLLLLPDHGVSHRIWGGVGPSGALGAYLGPAECDDAALCDTPFGPVYEAAGLAGEEALDLTDVVADSALVDFRTFVSLHATPSDGFKPVNPVQMRTDPFQARWTGDLVAVEVDGTPLLLSCAITVSRDVDYVFREFQCDPSDPGSGTGMSITSPDATSLQYQEGKVWFAFGPGDDDLMLVGRVGAEGPWAGIVARRGDVWSDTGPIDPADVPIEYLRGTFKFFGWPLQ